MKATNVEKKLNNYLKINLVEEEATEIILENVYMSKSFKTENQSISNYIKKELDKNSFQTTLFNFIDKTNKKDSEIYNKAFIDRRLFSKIRNDSNYHPSKNTVISLGIALELNINDFEKLLQSASYSLPKNNYFDLIIRFCIEEKIYNMIEINNYLNKYNCTIIS